MTTDADVRGATVAESQHDAFRADWALVVFSDNVGLVWLRLLKRGFRHCFAVVRSGGQWVLYNPRSSQTEIAVLPCLAEPELRRFFRRHGARVVALAMPAETVPPPAPWGPFICVEAVKRLLGIRRRGIVTPWALYTFLKNENIENYYLMNRNIKRI